MTDKGAPTFKNIGAFTPTQVWGGSAGAVPVGGESLEAMEGLMLELIRAVRESKCDIRVPPAGVPDVHVAAPVVTVDTTALAEVVRSLPPPAITVTPQLTSVPPQVAFYTKLDLKLTALIVLPLWTIMALDIALRLAALR